MKKHTLLCMVGMGLCSSMQSFGQIGKICNWDSDKKAAAVLTFDDWSPGHFPFVYPALQEKGLVATFFVTTKYAIPALHPWPDVVLTVQAGNEVGNHTLTHPHLKALNPSELSRQVRGAKNLIDSNVTNQSVLTFAYPFGEGAGSTAADLAVRDSLKRSGHIAARATSGVVDGYNFAKSQDDYFRISTFTVLTETSTSSIANQLDKTIATGGLLTFMYHSVNDVPGGNGEWKDNWFAQILVDTLRKQMDEFVERKNRLWVTTFANAVRYHQEKNCATLKQIAAPTTTKWVVELTDTLSNNEIYNQPLTLKLPLKGKQYKKVTQKGRPLEVDSIYADTIMFSAVPDGGPIELSVASTTGLHDDADSENVVISPVPSHGSVTILYPTSWHQPNIILRDLEGIAHEAPAVYRGNEATLDLSFVLPGVYSLELSHSNGRTAKRLVTF